MMRVWLWPLLIALLTLMGLVAGLIDDGAGDWLGWFALGLPVAISLQALRRAGPRKNAATGVRLLG